MTTVTFRTDAGRVAGFTSRGHAGTPEDAGRDLVCAAVTSAVRLTETTVNDVLGLSVPVRVREEEPSVTLTLPAGLPPEADAACQALLTGLMVYFDQLHQEYPDEIEVLAEDART